METKIRECQTLKELSVLQSQSVLNEMEQRIVFERQTEIFQMIMEWRLENEQLGLAPDLTDTCYMDADATSKISTRLTR